MQIYMQSERGEIEVYLCPDDDSASPCFNSPIKRHFEADEDSTDESVSSPIKVKREVPSSEMSPMMLSSRLSHRFESLDDDNKFALIAATPDFGPIGSSRIQLETLDQDPCGEIFYQDLLLWRMSIIFALNY